jgi:hypothetical protein
LPAAARRVRHCWPDVICGVSLAKAPTVRQPQSCRASMARSSSTGAWGRAKLRR